MSEPARGLTFEAVVAMATTLPGVIKGTSYATPALRVSGKVLARLTEDGATMVLRAPFPVRDHLVATAPETFSVTDHYRDYPLVLVRLAQADPAQVRELLESAWRQLSPARVVAAGDARGGDGA